MGRSKKSKNSSWQAIRYDEYRMNARELLVGAGKGVIVCAILSYTFFRSILVFMVMAPIGVIGGIIIEKQRLLEKRKKELSTQFKESMVILASSLSAGYSVENALAAEVAELSSLFGENGLITREFSYMVHQIRTNRSVEQVLDDFSERSGLEDIQNFSEVFAVAKRSSGDLGNIMKHTAEVIRDKMQVEEEIMMLTASKQFEQKIMNLIPFFIVIYVESASPGFFNQMYQTALGRVLMSVCMVIYLISYVLSKKILAIEI